MFDKDKAREKVLKMYPQYQQGLFIERKKRVSKRPPRKTYPAPDIGKIISVDYNKEKGTLKIIYEKNNS